MSAIAAVYNLNGKPVDTFSLEKISAALAHRGADDYAIWQNREAGLVHRMHWVTPESLIEKLPAQAHDAPLFITCDARLDNRDELIPQLPFRGKKHGEITDSDIILAAYQKWGEDCLPRLIGDFVFVIWNAREKTLFAARDPLGVKHFYYYYQPGKLFALASEIKALLTLNEVPCELNEEHLADYLVINAEDKENTFYKNILRLRATHALVVNEKGLRVWRYWKPAEGEIKLKNDAEYHEAFKEKFTNAVTARLRSAYPVGSMLSGGLDSSSIVCVASEYLKKQGREPLHTYSAIFPTIAQVDSRIDERQYMQSVIEKSGCQPHFVNVDDGSPLRDIEKVLWHTDHPTGAPIYMDWEIFKAANRDNVRVVMSGIDGDSTVSHGYEDFAHFAQRGWYLRLVREAAALKKNMPRRSHSLKRSIWHRGITKAVPDWAYSAWRTLRRRQPSDYTRSPILFPLHLKAINTEFRKKYDVERRIVELREAHYPDGLSSIQYHWNALTNGHFAQVLENLEKASAAFNIEPRFPFFDRRLIEFCIALPPGHRIYKGWTRSIFRFAMNGILPPEVQWRTDKANIGANVKINLLKYGFTQLENAVHLDSRRLAKYVDLELLKSAYQDYQANPMQKETEAMLMLTNVYLSNWLGQAGFDNGANKHSQTAIAA